MTSVLTEGSTLICERVIGPIRKLSKQSLFVGSLGSQLMRTHLIRHQRVVEIFQVGIDTAIGMRSMKHLVYFEEERRKRFLNETSPAKGF